MKKILLLILLIYFNKSFSQSNNSLSFNFGLVQNESYGYLINYNYNSNRSNYEIGVNYSQFKENPIPDVTTKFNSISLQLGYLHTLLSSRDNSISINGGFGASVGQEKIGPNKDVVILNKDGLMAGVYGVVQLDFYVSDNFAFLLRGQHNYLFKSETGKMNPFLGVGLKFNF